MTTQKSISITAMLPHALVSNQMLNQIHGDILLIRANNVTQICNRSAATMRQQAISWLNMAANEKKACFIVGHISAVGGRFQFITRDQAIELVAVWIFEEAQHGVG